ncbi:MAG: hypothetical protein K2Y28_05410 [Burkholderiaceae bacterium]|nr:hypothetical protein [Burkholderiaceae bacterium]
METFFCSKEKKEQKKAREVRGLKSKPFEVLEETGVTLSRCSIVEKHQMDISVIKKTYI